MSESKIIPNRNFLTIKEQKKLKNFRHLQEKVIHGYVIYYVITFV